MCNLKDTLSYFNSFLFFYLGRYCSSIKELEKKLNSKEFKNGIVKIKKVEFHKKNDGKVQSFPPMNIDNFNRAEKSKLSKAEQKKLEKLSKERAELAKKQAEIAKKQAELAKQQAEQGKKQAEIAKQQAEISRKYAVNNPWVIRTPEPKSGKLIIMSDTEFKDENGNVKRRVINKNSDGITINFSGIGKSDANIFNENTKIYINGKLSSKEEMDKLKPEYISTVNVYKNMNNGKEEGEIRIQTK